MPPLVLLAGGLALGGGGLVGAWPWWAALVPLLAVAPWVRRVPLLLPAALLLCGLAAGSALTVPAAPWPPAGGLVRITATVSETWTPRDFSGGQRLVVDGISAEVPAGWRPPGQVFVIAPALPGVRPGDRIAAAGHLEWTGRRPELQAVRLELVAAREDGAAGWAWRALRGFHERSALAEALLLGRGDPPETPAFRASGLLHLLAVSGMHLVLATVLGLALLRAAGTPWAVRLAAGACLVVGYTWLTGAAPATQRACAMGLVVVLYDALARRPHPLGAVSAAVVAIAAWEPGTLRSLGFQLSLAAAAGIASLGVDLMALRRRWCPLLAQPLDRLPWRGLLWLGRGALDSAAVGFAATLAVTPLIAWTFGSATPWGALATVVAAVPCTLALWLGLPALVLAGLWPGGPWAGLYAATEGCLDLLARCAELAAALPGATLASGAPPLPVLLAWPLLFWRLRTGGDLLRRCTAAACLIAAWGAWR
jgi:ComEC/Rec2-related protein